MKKYDLSLYAITDSSWLKGNETLNNAVKAAIIGGATIVQYREKKLTGKELEEDAISVRDVCREYNIPFIVNDDVYLAKKIGADGVHVGQSDMSVSCARDILGKDCIIGATAKTVTQAKDAQKQGADYLGSGAVFGTTTKTDAKPMSFETLTQICENVSIPVVAIGGIDENNIHKLKGLPIAGVAVVSAIFSKDNKIEAARILRERLGK